MAMKQTGLPYLHYVVRPSEHVLRRDQVTPEYTWSLRIKHHYLGGFLVLGLPHHNPFDLSISNPLSKLQIMVFS